MTLSWSEIAALAIAALIILVSWDQGLCSCQGWQEIGSRCKAINRWLFPQDREAKDSYAPEKVVPIRPSQLPRSRTGQPDVIDGGGTRALHSQRIH